MNQRGGYMGLDHIRLTVGQAVNRSMCFLDEKYTGNWAWGGAYLYLHSDVVSMRHLPHVFFFCIFNYFYILCYLHSIESYSTLFSVRNTHVYRVILVAYILYDVICVSATRSIAGTKGVDGQWSTDIPRKQGGSRVWRAQYRGPDRIFGTSKSDCHCHSPPLGWSGSRTTPGNCLVSW